MFEANKEIISNRKLKKNRSYNNGQRQKTKSKVDNTLHSKLNIEKNEPRYHLE